MMSKGLFHGQGKYKQPADGSEYSGTWLKNEMRGQGIKKLKYGEIEISGFFINQHVSGKGYKKWRQTVLKNVKGVGKMREIKHIEWFIYRGDLENSQI